MKSCFTKDALFEYLIRLKGYFFLAGLYILIPVSGFGQPGCINPATVTLSSISGSTCGTSKITIRDNLFGGSAKDVKISTNGRGSVSPTSVSKSPFSFTYTPDRRDIGKEVIITVTTNDPPGPCEAVKAIFTLWVSEYPSEPDVGRITQPTCTEPTGSVELNKLPAIGSWTINPVGFQGSGTSTTVTGLTKGEYEFTVTNSFGCESEETDDVDIDAPPPLPSSPTNTVDCSQGYGNAIVKVSSPLNEGFTYRLGNGPYQSSTTFTNVANGSYTITVRNSSGCTTTGPVFSVLCGCVNPPTVTLSSNHGSTCVTTPITVSGNTFGGSASGVIITGNGAGTITPALTGTQPFAFTYVPAANDAGNTVIITVTTNNPLGPPCEMSQATYTLTVVASPSAPVVGTITHPTCTDATGSVALSGLPSDGTWSLTRTPDGVITTGTGTSTVITGLAAGTYNFQVTNLTGCASGFSSNATINAPPAIPTLIITNPPAVCFPLNVDLTDTLITIGSTPGLTFSYWLDINATIPYNTPAAADGGTYFIKGTTSSGCSDIKPVSTIVSSMPLANAGIGGNECGLSFTFNPVTDIGDGTWSGVSGPGSITFSPNAQTANALVTVTEHGTYTFRWTVVNGACSNSATVTVNFIQQLPANAGSGGYVCDKDFNFNASLTSGTGTWTKISGPGDAVFSPDRYQPDAKVSVDRAGSYDFAWTEVTSICTSTDIVRVIFRELPALDVGMDIAICRGASFQFNAMGTGVFDWTPVSFVSNPYISNPFSISDTTTIFTVTLTDQFGCKNSADIKVEVRENPVADAGKDMNLWGHSTTRMDAKLDFDYEAGSWSILAGTGDFSDASDPKSSISGLASGINQFLWTVSNGVCPSAFDSISINVHDFFIPTLITPNQDGRNDYFVISGLNTESKTELIVFDKRGIEVYRNPDYDNRWDGVDYKQRPLREDTYFYILNPKNSKPVKGFVVIRR